MINEKKFVKVISKQSASGVSEQPAEIKNQDVYITRNGTYSAGEGYTGIGTAIVNVPIEADLGVKSITSNGTFNAETDNLDGFSTVMVDVHPTGTRNITANGSYDVENYATANVNVPINVTSLSVSENGVYTPPTGYHGYNSVTVNVQGTSQPVIQALTVEPKKYSQTTTASGGIDGYSPVTVEAVTAAIDSNIVAGNIKNGVTILGVTGNYSGSPVINSLSITPSTSQQTFTASGGVIGYSPITVAAVTSSIDANIVAGNIKSGVSILGVAGTVVELVGETRNVSITSTSGNTFTPSSGKNGITSIKVTPTNQSRTVTPTTSQQTLSVNSGYSGNGTITVNAVTSSIDANIIAGNIKSGVSILGVAGSMVAAPAVYIEKAVVSNKLKNTTTSQLIDLSNVKTFDQNVLYNAYRDCTGVTQVPDMSRVTSTNSNCLSYCFYGCTNMTGALNLGNLTSMASESIKGCFAKTKVTSVDMHSLEIITYGNTEAFWRCSELATINFNSLKKFRDGYNWFAECTSLTSASFPALLEVGDAYGTEGLYSTFSSCTALSSVSFPLLTTVYAGSYYGGFEETFYGCTSLTSVSFPSVNSVYNKAFKKCFSGCTSLTDVYFNALTSNSFNSKTNQFNLMLSGCTGVRVHFPSNLQSVIGSWSDITNGMGGTNTTVLFDLTATS